MKEKPPTSSEELKERPNLLDVVKIDGHWAQTIMGGDTVRYLDDGAVEMINWNDYELVKSWSGLPVAHVKEQEDLSDEEIERIHWGPEQKEHPHLKEVVSVFGEFKKK